MKVEKNKIYESLKADAELKDKILKESIKTIKTVSLPGDDELSLRRNEKMKKKEYGDAFKKVAIASFSLIATGGIIAGVINYNNSNKQSAKIVGNNINTEFSTGDIKEETTEKVTEAVTEETTTEEKNEVNTNLDDNKFHSLDFDSLNGSAMYRYIDSELGHVNVTTQYAKVCGDYSFKLEFDADKKVFKLGLIKGDDYTLIEKSKDGFDEYTFRTYKDKVVYSDDVGIKELNLRTLKKKYIFKHKDVSIDCSSEYVFNMDDKYMYFSGKTFSQRPGATDTEDTTGVQYYTYAYNLKTKEVKLLENRLDVCMVDENCFIMAEVPEYPYEDIGHPYETPLYLVKIHNGKAKDIAFLGERVLCDFLGVEKTPAFSDKDKNKFYYINYEKKLDSGLTDYNEFTVMSYDMDTKKIEKVAKLSTEKLGIGSLEKLKIDELNDDYIKFLDDEIGDDVPLDAVYKTYFYYFETGKVEASEEKVYK